jgi:hypothetical protein
MAHPYVVMRYPGTEAAASALRMVEVSFSLDGEDKWPSPSKLLKDPFRPILFLNLNP